jgi:hypothetical protein
MRRASSSRAATRARMRRPARCPWCRVVEQSASLSSSSSAHIQSMNEQSYIDIEQLLQSRTEKKQNAKTNNWALPARPTSPLELANFASRSHTSNQTKQLLSILVALKRARNAKQNVRRRSENANRHGAKSWAKISQEGYRHGWTDDGRVVVRLAHLWHSTTTNNG